jgi:hypothetical protein
MLDRIISLVRGFSFSGSRTISLVTGGGGDWQAASMHKKAGIRIQRLTTFMRIVCNRR